MAKILYHAAPGDRRKEEKYQFLDKSGSVAGVKWTKLMPDKKGNWITNDTDEQFDTFILGQVITVSLETQRLISSLPHL